MALVGNILLGTGAAPGMSSIASAYAESAASSNIPWSALEYSGQTITAISGSAIGGQGGGGGDTSQCMPISGMTAYQTVSSISSWTADLSSISSKQDALTFGYSGEYISSINGSAIIDTQGGGVTPEEVSAIASSYADDKLDKTASSTFQPSGNYAYASSLSSYLPKSASSNFAPSGDYAFNSSLTGYLKNSASSTWYPMTGNPSGFLTAHQSLTGYVQKSSISSQSSVWNSVSAMVPQSSISAQSSNWGKVTATAGGSSQVSSINGSAILDLSTYNALTALSAIITANSAKWNKISSVSGLTSITANKYTLSAGTGISLTNDTANKVTIISVV